MKIEKTIAVLAMAAVCGLPAVAANPAVPQAPVITYGLIRDEYGAPMTKASSAALTLVRNADRAGATYAACAVGDMGIPGMNYRLSLEIDSSGPVRPTAVTVGTEMFVKATVGDVEQSLSPVATFVTPAQGTKQRLDFSLGADLDGDGLPDSWEEWVLDLAGRDSSAAGIAAFRPDGDADGDGMTNLQEFLAGTDPFIATDLLKIDSFELVPGTERAKLTFLTAVDHRYRVVMTESLERPVWTPVATARDVSGEFAYEFHAGNGRRATVFVDARLQSVFFRVAAD